MKGERRENEREGERERKRLEHVAVTLSGLHVKYMLFDVSRKSGR